MVRFRVRVRVKDWLGSEWYLGLRAEIFPLGWKRGWKDGCEGE